MNFYADLQTELKRVDITDLGTFMEVFKQAKNAMKSEIIRIPRVILGGCAESCLSGFSYGSKFCQCYMKHFEHYILWWDTHLVAVTLQSKDILNLNKQMKELHMDSIDKCKGYFECKEWSPDGGQTTYYAALRFVVEADNGLRASIACEDDLYYSGVITSFYNQWCAICGSGVHEITVDDKFFYIIQSKSNVGGMLWKPPVENKKDEYYDQYAMILNPGFICYNKGDIVKMYIKDLSPSTFIVHIEVYKKKNVIVTYYCVLFRAK